MRNTRICFVRRVLVAVAVAALYAGGRSGVSKPFTSSAGPSPIARPGHRRHRYPRAVPPLADRPPRRARASDPRGDARPGRCWRSPPLPCSTASSTPSGPGHGKTIVSTFFLAKDAKLRHSLIAGYFIAVVHAVSALTIVLALFFIVRGVFSTGFESASRIVQTLSFGAIALIGAFMLVQRIRGKEHSHRHHEHKDEHEGESGPSEAGVSGRELFGIALASGVVPCPGASAIILVCLSLNVMLAGIVAVTMIRWAWARR